MDISEIQKEKAQKAIKKHGLEFAVLFGSQIHGKPRQNSDIDIAALDQKEGTYERYGTLFNDFSNIFKVFAYKNYVDSKPLFELKTKILQKQQQALKRKIKYD